MAKEFFNYDPTNGMTEWFDYDDETDTVSITRSQDVTAAIDRATRIRNEGILDRQIKEDNYLCHYCDIPLSVILEMRGKGIDVFNDDHAPRVFDEINKNYPYLKLTNLTHAIRY